MLNSGPGHSPPGRVPYVINYRDARIPEALDRRFAAYGFSVDLRHAWSDRLPDSPRDYSAVFLSGSEISLWEDASWIEDERRLIREFVATRTPTLGIAFGTQILAYELLGTQSVFRRNSFEIGLVEIRVAPGAAADPLLAGLPSSFPAFSWHRDEFVATHADMRVLATSRDCGNHLASAYPRAHE